MSESVDERWQTLAWLHDAIVGEADLTPAEFSYARERLNTAGVGELVAVGLVAQHLRLIPARRDKATLAVGRERIDYVVDTSLSGEERATARAKLDAALHELFQDKDLHPEDELPEIVEINADWPAEDTASVLMCAEDFLRHHWPDALASALKLIVTPRLDAINPVTADRWQILTVDPAELARQLVWLLIVDFPWVEHLATDDRE